MHRFQVLTLVAALVCLAPTRPHEFSGERALAYTAEAVRFGPRPSGSAAIHRLQAAILSHLRLTGCRVHTDDFTAQTPNGPLAMRNLECLFPGTSGRTIVITGHYDTKILPNFVGANDGGSSTGFLLELAAALAGAPRVDDVEVIFFDGEEAVKTWTATDSLYGSRHLAEKWNAEGSLAKVKALINVDMIGDRDLELVNDENSTERVRELVWKRAESMGYARHFPRTPGGIEDDHMPFLHRGVPSLDLIDFSYGPNNSWWHTPQDTMDKLSAASFEVIGKVLLATIRDLEAQP